MSAPDPTQGPTAPAIRAPSCAGPEDTARGGWCAPRRRGGRNPRGNDEWEATAAGCAESKLTSEKIQFVSSSGQSLLIGVRTDIGKAVIRRFGQTRFWDDRSAPSARTDGHGSSLPRPHRERDARPRRTAQRDPRLSEGDCSPQVAAPRDSKIPLTARAS